MTLTRRIATHVDAHVPWHIAHEGYSVLVTRPDGDFDGVAREGLYDYDTRILSCHRLTVDAHPAAYVSGGVLDDHRWFAHLVVRRPGGTSVGPRLPQDVLEVALTRRVGCGMEERIDVVNHAMEPVRAELALALDADFADAMEVSGPFAPRGETTAAWSDAERVLRIDYHATHGARTLHRALRVAVAESSTVPQCDARTLRFALALPPRGRWRAVLRFASLVDGTWREPLACAPTGETSRDRRRAAWRRVRAVVEASDPVVQGTFERAADDLLALRAWEYDGGDDAWIVNAGVPTYTGLFGRDLLTAGWQGALLGPEMMRGALAHLAAEQATTDDPWRDAEPGKMLHEARRGPLAELDVVPQRRYYGEQTAPSMFVIVLSEYWHWTGDDAALRRHRDAALRAFEWADRYGDRDGDGLLESVRRSSHGLKNQAWKDSDEAIRYPDGTLVANPLATIEEQGYHYIALQRMAELLLALGEEALAERYLERARALRTRVHEAFWMPDERFYAMALDPDKRRVASIGSNAGHVLAAGLVPREHAGAVADRLFAPDLFSGWGVRTLSSAHPSYNPYAYHLGTVWPVENATFALGCRRYGLDEHAERLLTGMLGAAACCRSLRLPEALSGHARVEATMPSVYPGSNAPQAWSASAVVQLVQVMLGLYPFAPARVLALVRPRLPAWLDVLVLRNVRVGEAVVSLRFARGRGGETAHEVLDQRGPLTIVTMPPPVDLHPERERWSDHLKAWGLGHLPGRLARALRVAIGAEG